MDDIKKLENKWKETESKVAFFWGDEIDKELIVKTRYDGFGNSVVRFIVKKNNNSIEYEKYDAAIFNYNLIKE